ncbi:MAG: hypothetical protein ACR2H0_07620 [Candidatus Limnocylindrales bacterium]
MTILRAMLFVLVVGALAVALYGLLIDTSALRLPLIVSGLAVCGIAAGLLGFSLAGSAIRLGERGRLGRALLVAFVGGLFVMGAAGALAGAIVLGLLTAAS